MCLAPYVFDLDFVTKIRSGLSTTVLEKKKTQNYRNNQNYKIIKSLLALQLIEIIKENELDYHPLIVHVIGSDGAMIYAKMHRLMQHYIHGAIIESLPAESSPNNLVKFLFKALI